MFTFTSTFMQKKLFYQIDILSPSPILYVYKEKRRPSYLGVILTILMIAITLIFSYNVIIKWIYHSNYTITYNKIISQESSIFNLNDTLFAFSLNIIDKDNYNFTINLIDVINDTITNSTNIDYELCSNQKSGFENIKNNNNSYYCLNNDNITYISNTLNQKETYLSFIISIKNNSNNNELNDQKDEINSPKNFDKEINMKFLFSTPKIDHNNFTNPIHDVDFFHNYNIPLNQSIIIDNYFKMINYQTKTGIITSHISEFNVSFYDESITLREISNNITKGKGIINFHISPFNIDSYLRTYPTVQEMLSQIGGITSIIFRCFSIFMAFFASTKNNYVIFSNIVNQHNNNIKRTIEEKNNNIDFNYKKSMNRNHVKKNSNNSKLNNFGNDNVSMVPKLKKPFLNSNSEEKKNAKQIKSKRNNNNNKNNNNNNNIIEIELTKYTDNNSNNSSTSSELTINEKRKVTIKKKTISKNGNLSKISLCNSFCIQIIPCKTKNKKILSLSEEFIRDCLGIENIIKTNCRMNQMVTLLNPERKKKINEIDSYIIESLKIIEDGGNIEPKPSEEYDD